MPIQLKRKNGQITPYRNSEYIPAYLFLPKELVERAPPELQLPRRIDAYFTDWNVIRAVESDLFLELMMDSYAYMVWNHLGFKGLMEAYSGYAPEYIIAHSCGYWVQELLDSGIIPSVETLYRSARHLTFGYVPLEEFHIHLSQIVPAAMEKHHLNAVLQTANEFRCSEDFDRRNSNKKRDFYRSWYHTRSPHTECSLEAERAKRLQEEEERDEDNCKNLFESFPLKFGAPGRKLEDAVIALVNTEQFLEAIDPTDRRILMLRAQGYTMKEIAEKTGFKTHSAVLKRLKKIGEAYEQFNKESD